MRVRLIWMVALVLLTVACGSTRSADDASLGDTGDGDRSTQLDGDGSVSLLPDSSGGGTDATALADLDASSLTPHGDIALDTAATDSAVSLGGDATTANLACDPHTGVSAPLATCSTSAPCYGALVGKYNGFTFQTLTTDSTPPSCKTANPNRPSADDSPALSASDIQGTTRYWCQYVPPSTQQGLQPLVIWLHGAGGSADHLYNLTHLRSHAASTVLGSDPQRPGFVLLAVQGRNLHWPTVHPDGTHHDTFYRNLATNPDVRFLDERIDALVAQQLVDPQRIYLMGWSNGAMFAHFYAIARNQQPTAGGNRVAAAAVFAVANPYERLGWLASDDCRLDPLPTTSVPLYIVNRDCDALTACNAIQQASFALPPGHDLSGWVTTLQTTMQNPHVTVQLIGATGLAVTSCAAFCTQTIGIGNHSRWPDGSGVDTLEWETAMLQFLQAHPLP